jgi:DNA-binding NarL/FixJ family response regulator
LDIVDLVHRAQRLYRHGAAPPELWHDALTRRQHDVLHALRSGLSEKQIAAALDLSVHTVHVHVKAIYRRFNVTSRGELLSLWTRPPTPQLLPVPRREHDAR